MPELPEVETTRVGIAPHLVGRRIKGLVVRQPQLRWPIPTPLIDALPGQSINAVERRAKYLLVHTEVGSAVIHLGMSGSLRVLGENTVPGKHDHYDWHLDSGRVLRFTDPRRFGSLLWQPAGTTHELLAKLGPEPLGDAFDGDMLWRTAQGRSTSVKTFIMDQAVVVGVGNIYAAEALFAAGIHPRRRAGAVSRMRYAMLADAIKRILRYAIDRGGTTLRDFISPDGVPGYFEQELFVYGRAGQACRNCGTPIRSITLGQRSTFYCPRCQH
ncbi:bifunctional DNA-formamidopyrimidine glycosylase/DNA-(apurinic or apyrimidinic site) lyase [Dokdonella immobilis]|uniref:Formamidopyrimidine-DNA glycosylase n=1 Tax=Dokdonella immobilis TaxID=578942 RepID=A0A1I4VMM3_9GAMM|nr:bifunctional DNA-formamidopyrimidine glycosylase/DNA-(apurinic or apyrimidinic site) lyase [Dokdonella immobilis]SFN02359.1 DNA-(apurinic or apyrimidinic site) lyase [Dokdonella immobilis]